MVYSQIISIIFPFVFVTAIAYIVFRIEGRQKEKRLRAIQAKAKVNAGTSGSTEQGPLRGSK